jgi:DNA-nicking Smr family endonuclease
MMREKPPANQDLDEDLILWQRVAQNVKPLRDHKNTLSASPVVKKPEHPAKLVPKIIKKAPPLSASSRAIVETSLPVDLRQGDRAGLDGRTQRRLFRGDVPIDRRIDLHGYTAARAEVKLQTFIEDAFYAGCRCILVITGKGAGVLKQHVPGWLKRPPLSGLVLALAEARPTDGGSGAFYVLLRRRR